ncbi:MAG: transcriptional regulator [Spirochaetaceae bacterium]|nr:transcriptional regulator [Spirochaetaceae bacterium]
MAIDQTIVAENLAEMSRALASAQDAELIEGFLFSLFTPSEADEIAKRWALVKDLAEGTPQREIAKELGLSLCKITRGSRELKKEGSPFKRMLEIAGYEVPERPPRRSAHPRPRPAEEDEDAEGCEDEGLD